MAKIKKIINNPLFNILIVIVITYLVYILLLAPNMNDIILAFQQANPYLIILCILLGLLSVVMGGVALSAYAKLFNPKFTIKAGSEACFIGAMAGGIMPFGSGTQVFQFYVFRKYDTESADAVSILFIDFIVYQATMIVTILSLILLRFSKFTSVSNWFWLVILGFLVNSFILLALVLIAKSNRVHHFVTNKLINVFHRFKIVQDKQQAIHNMNDQIEKFRLATSVLSNNRKALGIGVISNFMRLMITHSLPYFIAVALGIHLEFKQLIDIIALSAFTAQLNAFFPSPGATGGTEVVFKSMFENIFLHMTLGVLVIWRFVTYYFIVIVGALVFIGVRKFKINEREE